MFYLPFLFLVTVKAVPIHQLPVASATGSCTSQTLDDSSVLSLCESKRSTRLFYQNGTDPSVLLASLSSSEVKIQTSLKMITGFVCSIILHNNKYGQHCYDSAEFVGLSSVLPGAGNAFPLNTFSLTAADSMVVGQPGTCFLGSDRLHFTGLSSRKHN